MIRWKHLYKKIPQKIKTSKTDSFEILWIDDPKLHGQTVYDAKSGIMQIRLNRHDKTKEAVQTYFHEFIHALTYSNNFTLTETEVRHIEKCLPYFIEFFKGILEQEAQTTSRKRKANKT